MGKKIDRFVLTAVVGTLFYLYYRGALESDFIAVPLALLSCAVVRRLFKSLFLRLSDSRPFKKRQIRRSANGAVMRLACLEREAALADVESLLRKHYADDFSVALIQSHPSAQVQINEIFDSWKQNRDCERLALCATCQSDSAAQALAASLKAPKVAIVNADVLTRLIAEHPDGLMPETDRSTPARLKIKRLALLLFNRRSAPRNLLFSVSMLAMYLLTGNIGYLLCACVLAAISLFSLKRMTAPERLF